jgi:hypothetical protein
MNASDAPWIKFVDAGASPSGKTRRWEVYENSDRAALLGRIQWRGSWRCYCFEPVFPTGFEHDCLRVIANFVEAETKKHKEKSA